MLSRTSLQQITSEESVLKSEGYQGATNQRSHADYTHTNTSRSHTSFLHINNKLQHICALIALHIHTHTSIMPPPPKGKNAKPPTNDAQLNELQSALEHTIALHEFNEMLPLEQAEKGEEDLNKASMRLRTAARAFAHRPMTTANATPDEMTDEQLRQTRRLLADITAEIQRLEDDPDAEARLIPSLHDFGKAFGLEVEKDRSKKQEESKQKGWMPKNSTPVRYKDGRECIDICWYRWLS